MNTPLESRPLLTLNMRYSSVPVSWRITPPEVPTQTILPSTNIDLTLLLPTRK